MTKNNYDDPKDIEFNPRPERIQKIRRSPLVVFVFIFVGIVIFQIFNISHKKKERSRQKKENLQKHPALNLGQMNPDKWFDKKIYDDIRLSSVVEEETDSRVQAPVSESGDLKSLKKTKGSGNGINEEARKTKLEIYRLIQSQEIERQKAYYNALKSPGKIARFKYNRSAGQEDHAGFATVPESGAGSDNALLSRLSGTLSEGDLNKQNNKIKFLKTGVLPGDYLPNFKQEAISSYEIKAGTFIPSALITGINSDLPGNVTAQVRQNVYDSVTGKYVLIPQGSKLIGEYDSNVTFGQNRALVVWTRLLFPDGSSINLQKMQGVDISGYAGFKDKVNHHYFRIYGNALLLSLVGAGYELLNPAADSDNPTQTVAANIGQQLAQTASEITRKNMDIQPTIVIRPGYKFNVFVLKDMILEEVQTYDQ